MNPFHKIDSFKQVIKLHHLLLCLRFFSSTIDLMTTKKTQVKCLSVDFMSIPLRLHLDRFMKPLHLNWTRLSIHYTYVCYFIIQFIGGNAVTEYNNLLKNISGMKNYAGYIYCVSTPFSLVFIWIYNLFIFRTSLTFKCLIEYLLAEFSYSRPLDTYLWKQMMKMNRNI